MSKVFSVRCEYASVLDLEALAQALLVLDTGSFRKAAELRGLKPSSVSRRIRALEDSLGTSLFQRQTKGAQPTRAGARILLRVRRVMDELGLIAKTGQMFGEGSTGELCIGADTSIAAGGARALLRRLLDTHPAVELQVIEGESGDHIGQVQALRVDAVLVVGRPAARGCQVETLWVEPVMVALAKTHPLARSDAISWEELKDARFLVSRMNPDPEIQDIIVQHFASLKRRPLIDPRPVGRDGLMALVGLGLGLSLVTDAVASVSYPGVVFRPLEEERLPFNVIWSEQNDNPVLRRFMSLARRWSREQAFPRKPATDAIA